MRFIDEDGNELPQEYIQEFLNYRITPEHKDTGVFVPFKTVREIITEHLARPEVEAELKECLTDFRLEQLEKTFEFIADKPGE